MPQTNTNNDQDDRQGAERPPANPSFDDSVARQMYLNEQSKKDSAAREKGGVHPYLHPGQMRSDKKLCEANAVWEEWTRSFSGWMRTGKCGICNRQGLMQYSEEEPIEEEPKPKEEPVSHIKVSDNELPIHPGMKKANETTCRKNAEWGDWYPAQNGGVGYYRLGICRICGRKEIVGYAINIPDKKGV